ncbi:MAG: hypothetical protein M9894_14425 [Planctomycetes bacterium]|nr:hypothetical protein [Planctomycetota bacterium]
MTPEQREQFERFKGWLAEAPIWKVELALLVTFGLLSALIVALFVLSDGPPVIAVLLMPLLGPPLLGVLLLGYVRRLLGVAARWDEVARARGLESFTIPFKDGGWRLSGDVDGVPVAVRTEGNRDRNRTITIVQVTLPDRVPADLRLSVEGFGDRLMKALGGQDVQVGDREVDDLLRVRGDDPEAIQACLHRPAVLDALRALGTHHRSFTVERALARIEEPRFVKDPEDLLPALDRLVALARALAA